MPDRDIYYCYPNSNVLINKLNIKDNSTLFKAEKELTYIRLQELQNHPIQGNYDFNHLKAIHKYIFQDIYDWAGKERTIEIGKGNLFCTTMHIQEYARSVFAKYYPQCYYAKDDFDEFVKVFADNYGDLNALHPFREGNGRAQREFARLVCLECGYVFDLSSTCHKEMLEASVMSFNYGDNSGFIDIFSDSLTPSSDYMEHNAERLNILTRDDLSIKTKVNYEYYNQNDAPEIDAYQEEYRTRINEMDAQSSLELEEDEEIDDFDLSL